MKTRTFIDWSSLGKWGSWSFVIIATLVFARVDLHAQPSPPGSGGSGTNNASTNVVYGGPAYSAPGFKVSIPKSNGTNYDFHILEPQSGSYYELYSAPTVSTNPIWSFIVQGTNNQTNFTVAKPTNSMLFYIAYAPSEIDSDRDGIPDGWEDANGINRRANDANADPDGDGFTNFEEYLNGSDPKSAPTFEVMFSTPKATGNIP